MYANVKRQKSIKHPLRNREDMIRIIQAFSHACVSVSDRDDCPLCGSWAHVFLCLISLSQLPISGKTIFMRQKCDFSEEMEASCPGLKASDYTGIIYLYHIGSVQLLTHANSLCLSLCIHSSVPMEAGVDVCCRLSGQSTHHGRLIGVCPHSWWLHSVLVQLCNITVFWKILYITWLMRRSRIGLNIGIWDAIFPGNSHQNILLFSGKNTKYQKQSL